MSPVKYLGVLIMDKLLLEDEQQPTPAIVGFYDEGISIGFL
jgi:hypothetical protein